MTDDDFLNLTRGDAKNHVLGKSQDESARLSALYKERHGLDLWQSETALAASISADAGTVANGGWWLFGLGLLGAVVAALYPVGVSTPGLYGIPDQVANIDKIAIRHMIMAASLASFVSGCVLIAAGAIQRELRRAA